MIGRSGILSTGIERIQKEYTSVMLRFCLLFSLLFSLGGSLQAQPFEFLPGTTYDSSVPTLRSVVGHDWGEKITTHQEAERYLQALQQALPARTRLIRYGETWQGRSLYILAVGSPETIARLDRIQAGMAKLADPRRLAAALNAPDGALPHAPPPPPQTSTGWASPAKWTCWRPCPS